MHPSSGLQSDSDDAFKLFKLITVWNQTVMQQSGGVFFAASSHLLRLHWPWTVKKKSLYQKIITLDDFARSSAVSQIFSADVYVNHKEMTMEGWVHFMKLGSRGELCPGAIALWDLVKNTFRFFNFKNMPPQLLVFIWGLESVFSKNICIRLHNSEKKSTYPQNEADVALKCGPN